MSSLRQPFLRLVLRMIQPIAIVALVAVVACGGNQAAQNDTNSGIRVISTDEVSPLAPSSPSLQVIQPTATPRLEHTTQPKFNPDTAILPTASPNIESTPVIDEQESLANRMDSINLKINVFRNLNSIREIKIQFVSQHQMRSRILGDFEEKRDETLKTGRLYRALGILSENDDLYQIRLSLLTYNPSSFYDPDNDTLYLNNENSVSTPSQIRTYVHEFVRGLQYQHFDIKSITERLTGTIDAKIASHALVKGDSTISELVFINQDMSEEERAESVIPPDNELLSALRQAPRVIQREFIFPLEEGAHFTRHIYETGGFETINKAYLNPPQSTEQILHPEKYEAGDIPLKVPVTDPSSALGDEWTVDLEDTLGEFLLQAYLEATTGPELALTATEGWGGDTVLLLDGPDDKSALILRAVWDTVSDAEEFFNLFASFTHARAGGTWEILEKDTPSILLKLPEEVALLMIMENTTLAIFAPDETILNTINSVTH